MTAKQALHRINPLPWIVDNVFKSLMGFMAVAAASGIWMLVVFFWSVPTRLTENQREHIEFKARLDSLEYWADETDRKFGMVYKKINEDKIELWEKLYLNKP